MKQVVGGILIMVGMLVAAGSAGDCDGACMEQANSLSTMLMVAAAGMAMVAAGIYFVKDSLFE